MIMLNIIVETTHANKPCTSAISLIIKADMLFSLLNIVRLYLDYELHYKIQLQKIQKENSFDIR